MIGCVVLGKYRVLRLLDEGGMSKIFVARQTSPDRDVVVKVLKETHLASAKSREHFRREIYIQSRFQHPHAVTYYDSAPNEKQGPVLVMEYLRGLDLGLLLHRQGRFTPERAGRLLAQLCDVLDAAHKAGVVHRDLKPGNLMILHPGTPQEQLKLMDFGLAKMTSLLYISPDELVDFTLPAAAGTPEYIAPEQVCSSDQDARGDLYSVGVVLFELLTGKRPFEGSDPQALMKAHVEKEPPTFAEVGTGDQIPEAVERLVHACLAKHPDQRPQTAKELAQRYEQALGKRLSYAIRRAGFVAPKAAAPSSPAPPTPPPLPPVTKAADRHAIQHSIEAVMPEAMAMLKLKGFIHDLGGDIVESVPGLIRVRLVESKAEKKATGGGLFGWRERPRQAAIPLAPAATEIELHMERRDPATPSRLSVRLIMRSANGLVTTAWRDRCQQISRDLQAYLMGR
jgi:serine/threonine-protein kinase